MMKFLITKSKEFRTYILDIKLLEKTVVRQSVVFTSEQLTIINGVEHYCNTSKTLYINLSPTPSKIPYVLARFESAEDVDAFISSLRIATAAMNGRHNLEDIKIVGSF